MDDISKFVQNLKAREGSDSVFNPYLDDNIAKNLELYFRLMKSHGNVDTLLVGEAPGYLGCKLTGIPFTSGDAVMNIEHPFLCELKSKIRIDCVSAEATATVVWEFLSTQSKLPLFWNSFPFHPHPVGNPDGNRAPTNEEVTEGVEYLQAIYEIFTPAKVLGLGRKGEQCAKLAFPEKTITYIRHPGRGGKAEFISGFKSILT